MTYSRCSLKTYLSNPFFSVFLQEYCSTWGWNGEKKMREPDTRFSFLIQRPIPLSITSEDWSEILWVSVYLKQWLKLSVQDIKCWPFCCAIAVWQMEFSGKTSMNRSGSVRSLLASTGRQVRKLVRAQFSPAPCQGWSNIKELSREKLEKSNP